MRVLGLDTTTRLGSVALLDDGAVVAELAARVRADHAESLLAHVDAVLRAARATPADLDLVAVARGPGSFTGIRIGLATAKGLALARALPIAGVSSLAALAMHLEGAGVPVAACIDARKGEVFACAYAAGGPPPPRPLLDEFAAAPPEAARRLAALGVRAIAGDGARLLPPIEGIAPADRAHEAPRAVHVARLGALAAARGEAGDAAALDAVYLRPSDAELGIGPKGRMMRRA